MLGRVQPRSLRASSGSDLKTERGVASCGSGSQPFAPGEARDPARQALRPGCEELAARIRRQMPAVVWRRAPKETEARPRGPKPPRWSAERRASRVMGRKAPRKRLACRVISAFHARLVTRRRHAPWVFRRAPERLSALRPPLFAGERSNDANPGRGKRAAGTRW